MFITACGLFGRPEPPQPRDVALKVSPSYSHDIDPIFRDYCLKCHNDFDAHGEYRMDTYADVIKGGHQGAAIILGDPDGSLLVKLVESLKEPAMPFHGERLTPNRIANIRNWIRQGAQDD